MPKKRELRPDHYPLAVQWLRGKHELSPAEAIRDLPPSEWQRMTAYIRRHAMQRDRRAEVAARKKHMEARGFFQLSIWAPGSCHEKIRKFAKQCQEKQK